MNQCLLFKKTIIMLLLALVVICQDKPPITTVTKLTQYSASADLILDPTNYDIATFFKMNYGTYDLKNAFTLHIRQGEVPESYTFNAKIVLVNKKTEGQQLINALSPGIPVSTSEITFTTQRRSGNNNVIYHYFNGVSINYSKDNYMIIYLKFLSPLKVKIIPPSGIRLVDFASKESYRNTFSIAFYAPLFIKLTIPEKNKAFIITERKNYYIHPQEIQPNPSAETNLSREINNGVYFIEFNIPGEYLGVPSFSIDIMKIENTFTFISLSDIRRKEETIAIDCSKGTQNYYKDVFDINDKDKTYDSLRNPIGIVIVDLTANAKFDVSFNSENIRTHSTANNKLPIRVLSSTNLYTMKVTCKQSSGILTLKYTYDYTNAVTFYDFTEQTPLITNKLYEIDFLGCCKSTSIKFVLENPENKTIIIENTKKFENRRFRSLAYTVTGKWTLNQSNPIIKHNAANQRYVIKADQPAYLNMIFTKNNDFREIVTGSVTGLHVQTFLYNFTDPTIKSYKITAKSYSPYKELRYGVDKGALKYIAWPFIRFINNIAYIKNPLLDPKPLEEGEFYYLAIAAGHHYPDEKTYIDFTIIPTPQDELDQVEKPGDYGIITNITTCNPCYENLIQETVIEEGPDLTALWVIMGLAGATALVIGGWFIYNCLLEKGFLKRFSFLKTVEPTSSKVAVVSEKTVQTVNKTNTNTISTKTTNPINAKYTPVTSTARSKNTIKKK